jgi:hypothetical protein
MCFIVFSLVTVYLGLQIFNLQGFQPKKHYQLNKCYGILSTNSRPNIVINANNENHIIMGASTNSSGSLSVFFLEAFETPLDLKFIGIGDWGHKTSPNFYVGDTAFNRLSTKHYESEYYENNDTSKYYYGDIATFNKDVIATYPSIRLYERNSISLVNIRNSNYNKEIPLPADLPYNVIETQNAKLICIAKREKIALCIKNDILLFCTKNLKYLGSFQVSENHVPISRYTEHDGIVHVIMIDTTSDNIVYEAIDLCNNHVKYYEIICPFSERENITAIFSPSTKKIALSCTPIINASLRDILSQKYLTRVEIYCRYNLSLEKMIEVPGICNKLSFSPSEKLIALAGVNENYSVGQDHVRVYDLSTMKCLSLKHTRSKLGSETPVFIKDNILAIPTYESISLWNLGDCSGTLK